MVDKTMMGDKCAELVRAAMIGALAVTLGTVSYTHLTLPTT